MAEEEKEEKEARATVEERSRKGGLKEENEDSVTSDSDYLTRCHTHVEDHT